jgi:4-hydroxyphenylpyruvate dioxygenase-like putative hemolysin
VALGQLGSLQIELIVPGPAPSTYQEFLARGGQGLHHYGYLTDDFDAARTNAMACGMTAVTEGGSQLTRFSYLEAHDAPAGTVVELVEATPAMTAFVATVAQAHEGWDGNQPVRHL